MLEINCIERMTPEEFQRKLWIWLEEKGIFSEMKTQLRKHMIEVLKSSEIGDAVSNNLKLKRSLSPKYKAINLMIAEYFLQQGYQYSLSIFTVEDPTLSLLPEQITSSYKTSASGIENFKFVDNDVWDIFETLGYSRNSKEMQELYEKYVDSSSNNSLVVCLIRCFSEILDEMQKTKQKYSDKMNLFRTTASQTFENYSSTDKNTNSEQKNTNELTKEVYQKMQIAFDHELEIMKENERKKYMTNLKMIESQLILKLKEEKNKFKEREIAFKKKLSKEFEEEFYRVREKERLKEIEIERNLQRELEIERQKLFEEYRSLAQKKNMDASTLIELQQGSLEAAIKAVQYQSNRLKKKENMLDKTLSSLNKQKFKNKSDFSCQFTNIDNKVKNCLNKTTQTVLEINLTNHVGCQVNIAEDSLISNDNKKKSKSVRTNVVYVSTHCQTESSLVENNLTTSNKSVQTPNNTSSVAENYKNFEYSPRKNSDASTKAQIMASAQNLIKNLQTENIRLKYEIQQQQAKINELLDKHSSVNKEVTEARLDAQELSHQVMELQKMIESNCASSLEQTPVKKKDSSRIENNIEKLKYKRSDIKFTDEGLQKIKDTLKMLEREGEELERSFREFKLKQLNKSKSSLSLKTQNSFVTETEEFQSHTKAVSPSYSLPKQSKDIKMLRQKDQLLLSSFNSDYICNYNMDEYIQNRSNVTERAFKNIMNFDKNILQNYITISKDVKMYNPQNPKAFADMLKERHLMKKNSSCDSGLKTFASIKMPKSDSHRTHPMMKYNKLNKSIDFIERKYQIKDPPQYVAPKMGNILKFSGSYQFTQKQNLLNFEKECSMNDNLAKVQKSKNVDVHFGRSSESNKSGRIVSSEGKFLIKQNVKNAVDENVEVLRKDDVSNSYNLNKTKNSKDFNDESDFNKSDGNINKSKGKDQIVSQKSYQNNDDTNNSINNTIENKNVSSIKELDALNEKLKILFKPNNIAEKNQNMDNVSVSVIDNVDHSKTLDFEKNKSKVNINDKNVLPEISENVEENLTEISQSNNVGSGLSIKTTEIDEKHQYDEENDSNIKQIDPKIVESVENKSHVEIVSNINENKNEDVILESKNNVIIEEKRDEVNETSEKIILNKENDEVIDECSNQKNLETIDESHIEQYEYENVDKIESKKSDEKDNEIDLKQNENDTISSEKVEGNIVVIVETDQDKSNDIEDNDKDVSPARDTFVDNTIQKEKSDELIMSSSLDISNNADISIPEVSEDNDNDSFWN